MTIDYGHAVGDKALKLVATTIKQCLRSDESLEQLLKRADKALWT